MIKGGLVDRSGVAVLHKGKESDCNISTTLRNC